MTTTSDEISKEFATAMEAKIFGHHFGTMLPVISPIPWGRKPWPGWPRRN